MIAIFRSQLEKAMIRLHARNEAESPWLRRHFAERYDIRIGLYSYGCFDRWRIPLKTRIGRYCSFAKTARILDANHPLEALTTHPMLYERRFGVVDRDLMDPPPIIVEDDVWFSHNATATPSCKFIGRGAVIGAGAVVTKDVPRYAIMAGIPARQIGTRFEPALIEAIEASQWWLNDKATLKDWLSRDRDAVMNPTREALLRLAGPARQG